MRFKDYLEDFMNANSDFAMCDYELWCGDTQCTVAIDFLVESEEEMTKNTFVYRLCEEIIHMYTDDLGRRLDEVGNEDDLQSIEKHTHNIANVLETVKSY